MRPLLAALALTGALVACGGGAGATGAREAATAADRQAVPPGAAAADPWTHLQQIATVGARNGGNRSAGSPGGRATEELVAQALRTAGWRVRLQPVRFPFFSERRGPRLRLAGGRTLRTRRDLATLEYSPGGTVRAPVSVVGGTRADAGCGRGDWRGFRRGRIALVRRGTCPFVDKARRAQAAGAAAMLLADRSGGPVRGTLGAPGMRIPVVAVSASAGTAIARSGRAVRLTVDAVSAHRTGRNVIAELPGRDGRRVVMAGAHHDSVLAGPGVNDDGSGISALLALAARLSAAERPRDTVRLGFWTAEELGLYGSRRHVALLSRSERRRIRAYVNLDMIASPNAVLETYGSGAAETALRRALDAAGPRPERASIAGASDHAPFARAGIEVGGVFTGASERVRADDARRFGARAGRPADPCYHRACDTLDNADRQTLATVTDAVGAALRSLAG